jgi:hypothetical protein
MRHLHFPHLHFVTLCVALGMLLPAAGLAQGVSASWDVTIAAQSLAMEASRLQPLLDQVKPQQWDAGAATATYILQLRGSQDEVRYLLGAAQTLGKQPEKLSAALETYFRLQSVEKQVGSLADGVRHYQDQTLGDQLNSVMAANGANRDQLREYISDLAQTREQEYKIVDSEAQRCRGILLRQPVVAPAKPAAPAAIPSIVRPVPTAPITAAPPTAPAAPGAANQQKGSR